MFAALDAGQFQNCFVNRAADVIAIYGKTSRRTHNKKRGVIPGHMVSAFAARQRLVLGQVKVADTSNEVTAIRGHLHMLAIERTRLRNLMPKKQLDH